MILKRICVFCGSSPGRDPHYGKAAAELGRALAGRGIELVYGGGSTGLMGILADAVLAAGGRVTRIIPHALVQREVEHRALSELRVVETMHERKQQMAELASAFIALPGGYGTLEGSPGCNSAYIERRAPYSTWPDSTTRCWPSSTMLSPKASSSPHIAAWCWPIPTRSA